MTEGGAAPRVRYREGQRLRAPDLADERAWRLEQSRRHLRAQHGWGIARGLELRRDGDVVVLSAGVAVDGIGRELIVPRPVRLSATALDGSAARLAPRGAAALDVWLVRGPDPASGRQGASMRLTAAGAAPPDPDHPGPAGGAAEDEWPVALGRLRHLAGGWVPVAVRRRQVRGRGGSVASPGGRVRIDLGEEARPGEAGFTVRVRDAAGELVPRWIQKPAGVQVEGSLALARGLALAPGRGPAAAVPGLCFAAAAAPLAVAAPWRCSRARTGTPPADELRLEIDSLSAAGASADSRLAVGFRGAGGGFLGCLRVAADRSVVVAGGLVLEGTLAEAPVQADPADPRFAEQLGRAQQAGLDAALLGALGRRREPLGLALRKISAVRRAEVGQRVAYAYYATNTGTLPLGLEITDSRFGAVSRDGLVGPRETAVLLRSFAVPADARGSFETTATVRGTAADGRRIEAVASHLLMVGAEDDLELIPKLRRKAAARLRQACVRSMEELANTPIGRLERMFPRRRRRTLRLWRQAAAQHQASGLTTFPQIAAASPAELRELFPAYRRIDLEAWWKKACRRVQGRRRKGGAERP